MASSLEYMRGDKFIKDRNNKDDKRLFIYKLQGDYDETENKLDQIY